MKETRIVMGMPVTVEIAERAALQADMERAIRAAFDHFTAIDERFSTFKASSEITAINEGRLAESAWSGEMKEVFRLAEKTKKLTGGYFDIKRPDGKYDPSGLVKGWAIWNAAALIRKHGHENFYVDAGGDIQTHGTNADGKKWAVGIKNPWHENENVKVVHLGGEGIATSGTYIRGDHIYNPKDGKPVNEIASMTVIGPNVYEADRIATAAFAMGADGIRFIERLERMAGCMIDNNRMATMTKGFEKYTNA